MTQRGISIVFASLALVLCASNNVNALWFFPVAVIMIFTAFMLNFEQVITALKCRDIGPRWIWIPLVVIVASALVQVFIQRTMEAAVGFSIIIWIPFLYLLGRQLGRDALIALPVAAAVESAAIILGRSFGWLTRFDGGFAENAHLSTILILVGVATAPKRFRLPLLTLATPAVILSSSQEGVIALVALIIVILIREDTARKAALPLLTGAVTVAVIISTGMFTTLYPDFTWDRFFGGDPDKLLRGRVEVVTETVQQKNMIVGSGWFFDNSGQTTHNVPLRTAEQFGIPAGLSWLFVVLAAFWKTKYKYAMLMLLVFGMFDHLVWTYLMPWLWIILGITSVEKGTDFIFKKEAYADERAVHTTEWLPA